MQTSTYLLTPFCNLGKGSKGTCPFPRPNDQPAARSGGAAAKGEPSLLPWERSRHNINCTSSIYSTPSSITSMNLLPVMIEPTWEYQENFVRPVASTASNYLAPSTSTYSHHYIATSDKWEGRKLYQLMHVGYMPSVLSQ